VNDAPAFFHSTAIELINYPAALFMTILLVTNDAAWRNHTRNTLSSEGLNIVVESNGRDGLKTLKMQGANLVVTDLKMPALDGVEFYKESRKIHKINRTPFIFVSPNIDAQSILLVQGLTNCTLFDRHNSTTELSKIIRQLLEFGNAPLPVPVSPPGDEPQPQSTPAAPIRDHFSARLLMVDDDDTFRAILRDTLEDEGYNNITPASDGDEAIELLRKSPFDLILLDIYMPTVSGFEVLKFVRENMPETRVIMITAYKDLKIAVEAKKLGAADFVAKPFIRSDLMETIKRILTQ
jgi:two-component system, chemotaxis family, chemotaxis protein CheY